MKNKVFKYIKIFISVALILSLVAPSYASLSASDGAAFVTKAEFDSALADFNSRLTTFEAGINSKIDSQVTSYLDRNGIWSGKKQSLDGSIAVGNDIILWDFTKSPKIDRIQNFTRIIATNINSGKYRTVQKAGGKIGGQLKIVNSVNKSGLAFVDFDGKHVTAVDAGCCFSVGNQGEATEVGVIMFVWCSQDDWVSGQYNSNSATYSTKTGTPNELSSSVFGMTSVSADSAFVSMSSGWVWFNPNLQLPMGHRTLSGFVRSGKPIYFGIGFESISANVSFFAPVYDWPRDFVMSNTKIEVY